MADLHDRLEENRMRSLFVRQVVTEKTKMVQGAQGQWVFHVRRDATKPDIKRAIEKLYDVTVTRVATCVVRGKAGPGRVKTSKGLKFFETRKPNWKKAVVTLKEGQRLPLA